MVKKRKGCVNIMRKTKIVCTIGPATDDDAIMRQIMLSGMNVARFNFSHGDHETHQKRFEQVSRLRFVWDALWMISRLPLKQGIRTL